MTSVDLREIWRKWSCRVLPSPGAVLECCPDGCTIKIFVFQHGEEKWAKQIHPCAEIQHRTSVDQGQWNLYQIYGLLLPALPQRVHRGTLTDQSLRAGHWGSSDHRGCLRSVAEHAGKQGTRFTTRIVQSFQDLTEQRHLQVFCFEDVMLLQSANRAYWRRWWEGRKPNTDPTTVYLAGPSLTMCHLNDTKWSKF